MRDPMAWTLAIRLYQTVTLAVVLELQNWARCQNLARIPTPMMCHMVGDFEVIDRRGMSYSDKYTCPQFLLKELEMPRSNHFHILFSYFTVPLYYIVQNTKTTPESTGLTNQSLSSVSTTPLLLRPTLSWRLSAGVQNPYFIIIFPCFLDIPCLNSSVKYGTTWKGCIFISVIRMSQLVHSADRLLRSILTLAISDQTLVL